MLKKLIIIFSLISLCSVQNTTCYRDYDQSDAIIAGLAVYLTPQVLAVGLASLSALIAYYGHKLCLLSDFYREKFTPFAKKVCFFLGGTFFVEDLLFNPSSKYGIFLYPLVYFGKKGVSAVAAYQLNDVLCKNDFYKEEVNPFLKKVCLFRAGTEITAATLAFALGFAAAISSLTPRNA